MKRARYIRLALLLLLIVLPLSRLNTSIGALSTIDNKYLENFPDINLGFSRFFQSLNNYLSERLGGRNRIISLNSLLNDKLFSYLEHSLYEYGKEGYIFPKLVRYQEDYEFLDIFSDYLQKIQSYCEERHVPFVYLLNPVKTDIYQRFLPTGYNYQNNRKDYFTQKLREKNINYVDNSDFLRELSYEKQVFNRKFDANHWNALGAFYGVNHLLERMGEINKDIVPNDLNDFILTQEIATKLLVSNFTINESIPKIAEANPSFIRVDQDLSNEILISSRHPTFIRTTSNTQNSINLLMFQGSYFNGIGFPFVARAVETYQAVHNYDNLLEFEYYFNLFQPNFVVITTAEYATTSGYFDQKIMQQKEFAPPLMHQDFRHTGDKVVPSAIENQKSITTVEFANLEISHGYYRENGKTYDLISGENGIWFISFLRGELEMKAGKLYLVDLNGKKSIYDLDY